MINLKLSRGNRYYIATHHLEKRIREINRPKAYRIYEMFRTMSILMWIALVTLSTFIGPVFALVFGNGKITSYPSANFLFIVLFVGLPVLALLSDKAIRKMAKAPNFNTWECPDYLPEDI